MVYFLLLCLSVTSLIQQCYTRSGEVSSRYECGRHGNFEYCIDGIPGCVIGCHCHPGYYFDTDTKICEPNAKLSEGIRRLYMSDPNRIYPLNTPMMTQNVPTQTTTNTLNDMVEEMSKDNDDLGEWLYNQFFKTIETQVINNTSDDKPLTRRMNNDVLTPDNKSNDDGIKNIRGSRRKMDGSGNTKTAKKKRKAHKISRSKGKKGKSKVHGLRRKLLRITEDDSLFESDEGSDSDEDSSSSSSKSSSESSSSEDKPKKDDRDHGHKKVLIFNRRPRPPLPSFIFLPNMESPYYPPIGLPPPPIMPMYPMVPVPPMAPFVPFIGVKESDSGGTTAASDAKTSSDATSVATSETTKHEEGTTTETNAPSESSPPEAISDLAPESKSESPELTSESTPETFLRSLRSRSKIHRERKPPPPPPPKSSEELFLMRSKDPEPRLTLTAKQLERIKLLNNLQERLKMKKRLQNGQSNDAYDQIDDMDLVGDIPIIPVHKVKHQNQKEMNRKLKDVNFKYLSQLIHRAKLNGTESPLSSHISTQMLEKLPETRRMYNQEIPLVHYNSENVTPKSLPIKDQNDEYFMNLGRQIASLIRDEDVKLGYMTTEAPVEKKLQDSFHAILNENRYTPQSYWERFVRSPLPEIKSYLAHLHFYNDDNQMNLFSLEDEVNTFASTVKPLTLQDIENILTKMQKNNTNIDKTNKPSSQPDVSFNVNLLPKKTNKVDNVYRRMYETPEHSKYNPVTIKAAYSTNNKQPVQLNNITNHLHPTNVDWNMARGRDLFPTLLVHKILNKQNIYNLTRHKLPEYKNSNHSSKLITKYVQNNNKINPNVTKMPQTGYLTFVKSNSALMTPNRPLLNKYPTVPSKYLMLPEKPKPTIMNYKSIKYFSDTLNNHHYMLETAYPLDIPTFRQSLSKRIETDKPSYFHHEYHHFDYLD